MKFKIGDKISYSCFKELSIVGTDGKHYILQDSSGESKRFFIKLIDKWATKL